MFELASLSHDVEIFKESIAEVKTAYHLCDDSMVSSMLFRFSFAPIDGRIKSLNALSKLDPFILAVVSVTHYPTNKATTFCLADFGLLKESFRCFSFITLLNYN